MVHFSVWIWKKWFKGYNIKLTEKEIQELKRI